MVKRLLASAFIGVSMLAATATGAHADSVWLGKQQTNFTIYSDQRIDVSVPLIYRGSTRNEFVAMRDTLDRARETVRKRGMSFPNGSNGGVIYGYDGSGTYVLRTRVRYATSDPGSRGTRIVRFESSKA